MFFFSSNLWKCCHFRCLRNKLELHRGSQHCVHLYTSTASSKHCTFSSHCLSPRFKKCPAVKTSLEWAAKTPTKAGKIFPEFVEISSRQNLHSFAALGKQIILASVWKLAHHKNAKIEIIYQRVMTLLLWCKKTCINKTQCQLCKRRAGPIITLSWSCPFLRRGAINPRRRQEVAGAMPSRAP